MAGEAGADAGGDAIEFLLAEHRKFEDKFAEFDRILETGDDERRRGHFADLRGDLSTHEESEELVIWPTVRAELADGDAIADARLAEEQRLKEALADLDDTALDSPEFASKARAFMQAVRDHAAHEEREVFPRLRAAVDASRLEQMGTTLRGAKMMTPTRPHPNAPNQPPGQAVAGMVAGVADRIQDLAENVAAQTVERVRRHDG